MYDLVTFILLKCAGMYIHIVCMKCIYTSCLQFRGVSRYTDTQTHRHTDTQTRRQTDTDTDRDRDTQVTAFEKQWTHPQIKIKKYQSPCRQLRQERAEAEAYQAFHSGVHPVPQASEYLPTMYMEYEI